MTLYQFLNELLANIEDLQQAINRIRETVKAKIVELGKDDHHS